MALLATYALKRTHMLADSDTMSSPKQVAWAWNFHSHSAAPTTARAGSNLCCLSWAFAFAHAGRNENKREDLYRAALSARRLSLSLCLSEKEKNRSTKFMQPYLYAAQSFVLLAVILMRRSQAAAIFAAVCRHHQPSNETKMIIGARAWTCSIDRASLCCFWKCSLALCNDLAVPAAPKFPPSFGTGA